METTQLHIEEITSKEILRALRSMRLVYILSLLLPSLDLKTELGICWYLLHKYTTPSKVSRHNAIKKEVIIELLGKEWLSERTALIVTSVRGESYKGLYWYETGKLLPRIRLISKTIKTLKRSIKNGNKTIGYYSKA